jgi:glutamine synthetase
MAGSDLTQIARDKGIEFFLASFVEMTGSSKAKLVPAEHAKTLVAEGAGFAGFAAGLLGQGPHDPDIAAIPDPDSLMVLPWRPNIGWLASNITVNGEAWPYCPRTILQRIREEARSAGYVFKCGVEAEFFLVRRTPTGIEPADPLDRLAKPCYDQGTLTRSLDFLTTLVKYMQTLGWGPYANDHEDANCQFEINWHYAECLKTADQHTFFKYMVRTLAEQQGWVATFMPKPFSNLTGSGAHFHMSLWDPTSDQNLFLDEADPNGLSSLAYHFIGGLKAHARGLSALAAPTVNSYKRLVAGAPRSGATWAPVCVTYGGNNRTQMLRIPGPGRVECRAVDGSANPYLAAAGILAAGLDGIRNMLPAGERNDRNMYEVSLEELRREGIHVLPATLNEAVSELENDPVLMAALGPEYGPAYVAAKRAEWRDYHNSVSQWEIENYLGVY